MTVWKFVIADPETPVRMPEGAEVLHVAEQRGQVCLWALVEPTARQVDRRFVIAGTGHPLPAHRGRFVGTVLISGGALVFHVWEDLRP